ncbi:hypothetical protein V8F20_001872 [Naviculisporaceae sp. PSN 640]
MATSEDGIGHYGACPPVIVYLPGQDPVEGTVLTPIDELDEVELTEDELRKLQADSVLGIPCALLPDPFKNKFLAHDIIFFRRSSNSSQRQQESISEDLQAQLLVRLATWINFLLSLFLLVFAVNGHVICHEFSMKPQDLCGLFAACLTVRLMALLLTTLLLHHHRARGLRRRMRYDELCTMDPLLYHFLPARHRTRVSNTILDVFNFLDNALLVSSHPAALETTPLLGAGDQLRYAPLSAPDRQQALNNGWLILHFACYPSPSRLCWLPFRGLFDNIYQCWQDWRRYRAAAAVYQALEEWGAEDSGIAVLEYSIDRIERESQDPRYARSGFHFLPKFVGDLEVNHPEELV